MMNWKNFTILLLAFGCLHLASIVFRGQVHEDHDDFVPPTMSASPSDHANAMTYRKFGDDGKRLLNSREGW